MIAKFWILTAAVAGWLAMLSISATTHAALDTVTLLGPPANPADLQLGQYNVGYSFKVIALQGPTAITAVGVYDVNHDGLVYNHPITFVDVTANVDLSSFMPIVLAGANPTGTDDFIYATLSSPLALSLNHTYLLEESAVLDRFANPTNAVLTSGASPIIGNLNGYYDGFIDVGGTGFVGPNLIISVPEPTSLVTLAIIGGGAALLRRKRS